MIGPYDKRGRVKRCAACARRKIKCEGGFPCRYCISSGRDCTPPASLAPHNRDLVVVQTTMQSGSSVRVLPSAQAPPKICRTLAWDWSTRMTKYFFSEFLGDHDFFGTDNLDIGIIASLRHSHASLQNATLAVALLHASRKSQPVSSQHQRKICLVALHTYQQSLICLQQDLDAKLILHNDACLWSTFFLGIFELMYDVTGEGWVKHMLYGTSRLLQLRGPKRCASEPGRSFFTLARVFEISRALISNEPTFLDESDWRELVAKIWKENGCSWQPKEAIYNIMTDCASLSVRGHQLDRQGGLATATDLIEIANTGLEIQASLHTWAAQVSAKPIATTSHSAVSHIFAPHYTLERDSLQSTIYYHTTSIFLTGIFYYRPYWNHLAKPILTASEVQTHVSAILSLTDLGLKSTNLAGVLFLYPLRVAGARARSSEDKSRILTMLNIIERKSFVVAGAFVEDLRQLWGSR